MGRTVCTEPQCLYKGDLYLYLFRTFTFSAPVQTGPGAHAASYTMSTRSFLGVKSGRGVTLTPHPLLVLLVMKE